VNYRIYCLYASMKDDPGPWLIAAEDEYAWEGDPDRCEASFKKVRDEARSCDWDVREVTLLVNVDQVCKAFEAPEVKAIIE
jgi:hypothetical protein